MNRNCRAFFRSFPSFIFGGGEVKELVMQDGARLRELRIEQQACIVETILPELSGESCLVLCLISEFIPSEISRRQQPVCCPCL